MLKLIAPFRAMFNLNSAFVTVNQADYIAFLQAVRHDLADTNGRICASLQYKPEVTVNIPEKDSISKAIPRYVSKQNTGSFYLSPHVMRFAFSNSESSGLKAIYQDAAQKSDAAVAPYSSVFEGDLASLAIDLHDNTIAILSIALDVNRTTLDKTGTAWDRLDEWTTSLVFYLLQGLYATHIYPFLESVTKFSVENGDIIIRKPGNYTIFSDMTRDVSQADYDKRFTLMWVNRTLCYFQDYPVNNWIRDLVRAAISPTEAEVHINKGNCIITLPATYNRSKIESFWKVAYPSQYYYAAMDVVNTNLFAYICINFKGKNSRKLHSLQTDLEDVINKVTLLQARFGDLTLEMQGIAGTVFDVLQQEWYFSTLVGNVQKKLEFCKANITLLHQRRMEKKVTALLVIAGLILCLAIYKCL